MAKYAYHRLDGNHKAIVAALKQVPGCTVEAIGRPVDVLVGFGGQNYLLEIKRPAGQLEASQEAFLARWMGQACVVRTIDEALAAIGVG